MSSFGKIAVLGLGLVLVMSGGCDRARQETTPLSPTSNPEPQFQTWSGETMGSPYAVKLAGSSFTEIQLTALKTEVEARLAEVNRQMSHYITNSELSQFNKAPARIPFKISADFAHVVRLAMAINRRSGGAFDPTLGPVINLWGFGEQTDVRRVPSDEQLRDALSKTGCRHLTITAQDELIKDIPELHLNLSAIAKGYGVDAMAEVLRKRGLTNFLVSISGEVFAGGHRSGSAPWQIGVSAPILNWNPDDPLVSVVALADRAVSTSGDYQKFFFDADGRRLCHVFDPRTGFPVQHNLGSVTIVAESCTLADALSTTLFVMGAEKGRDLIEQWPGVGALFVVRKGDGSFDLQPTSRFPKLETVNSK